MADFEKKHKKKLFIKLFISLFLVIISQSANNLIPVTSSDKINIDLQSFFFFHAKTPFLKAYNPQLTFTTN